MESFNDFKLDLQSCRECEFAEEPVIPIGSNNADVVFFSIDPYTEEFDMIDKTNYSRYIDNVMLYFPSEFSYYFTTMKFCEYGILTTCVKKWKKLEISFLNPRILIVIGDLSFKEESSSKPSEYTYHIQNNYSFMGGTFRLLILPAPQYVYQSKEDLAYFNKKLSELQYVFCTF